MYHWVHKTERHHQKAQRRVNVFPLVSETVFWCWNTLSFSLHPPILPPTRSHAPSTARHAADELKESMSVGRQGGEKRKKEDIRKNSFSEFRNKKHGAWICAALWVFLGYLGQPSRAEEHLDVSTRYFGQKRDKRIDRPLRIPVRTTRPRRPWGASLLTSSTKHIYCM